MSDADSFILWVNAAFALLACGINVWAGITGWSDWRWLRFTIAGFAAFYAVAYVPLALGWIPVTRWSPFMRGVSIPVWLIVWSWPAAHSTFVLRRLRTQVSEELQKESVPSG